MGKLKTDCSKLQEELNKYNRSVICEFSEHNNACYVRPSRRNEKPDFLEDLVMHNMQVIKQNI